ncbi:MAG: hypothetical protein AAB478_02760 [Patescibacteria group bacterium]
MNNKIAIESLSMDLMRVAIGYHRRSIKMAERFSEESLKRITEVNRSKVKPYFAKILDNIPNVLSNSDIDKKAEDALMYSILCKNYVRNFLD